MITGYIDEKFPKWALILLIIFGDASAVYRILRFVDDCIAKKEKKDVKSLVLGILCCIPFVLFVFAIVDLVKLCAHDEKFTFLA